MVWEVHLWFQSNGQSKKLPTFSQKNKHVLETIAKITMVRTQKWNRELQSAKEHLFKNKHTNEESMAKSRWEQKYVIFSLSNHSLGATGVQWGNWNSL